ncbi:MAG TPA: PIN domain-containing protein [Thermoplasmata archaeon]|nr:PIN domain-containing protein [Thermoplasmata archaeon]
MVSLDTTFLIDLRKGVPVALLKAQALEEAGEPKCVTSPAAAELFVGAYRAGGAQLERTRMLLGSLVLLDADLEACEEAGRMGAELLARGEPLSANDLLIAAISKRHGQRLLTRDRTFVRVPGLTVESY